jgi:uncharacterized membrane protein (UPF0127 family)
MSKSIKIFLFIFFSAIVLTGCLSPGLKKTITVSPDYNLIISQQKFNVELADTPAKQVQGLSGRESLGESEGMLFILPETSTPGFWMLDMKFPIDIIWIKDQQIVDWVSAWPVSAGEQLPIYYPPQPVNQVLEIKAGYADKIGIQKGENITYSEDLDSFINMR